MQENYSEGLERQNDLGGWRTLQTYRGGDGGRDVLDRAFWGLPSCLGEVDLALGVDHGFTAVEGLVLERGTILYHCTAVAPKRPILDQGSLVPDVFCFPCGQHCLNHAPTFDKQLISPSFYLLPVPSGDSQRPSQILRTSPSPQITPVPSK